MLACCSILSSAVILLLVLPSNRGRTDVAPMNQIHDVVGTENVSIASHINQHRDALRKLFRSLKNFTVSLARPTGVPLSGVTYMLIKAPITAFVLYNLSPLKFISRRLKFKFTTWRKDWRDFMRT